MSFINHYKKGELVFCAALTNIKIQSGWGIIIDIIDIHTGEIFFEKEIITGMGDKNTKVKLEIDIIAINKPFKLHFLDPNSEIVMLQTPERFMVNPHDVYKIDDISKEFTENEFSITMKRMEVRRNFLSKYSKTRDEKIDILLED